MCYKYRESLLTEWLTGTREQYGILNFEVKNKKKGHLKKFSKQYQVLILLIFTHKGANRRQVAGLRVLPPTTSALKGGG
jgi:hypothetical protein